MPGSAIFHDSEFGDISVSVRANMRSISAHWRQGYLLINAYPGVTHREIAGFIEKLRPRIAAARPTNFSYHFGQVIHCFRHTVTIGTHTGAPSRVGYGGTGTELYINLAPGSNLDSPAVQATIAACLKRLMADRAEATLIPFAREVSAQIGIAPIRFEIGRGLRKLGHCTASRVIQLSSNIMFFPEPLVRYVICHELAHLTEMNHSTRFHALCNRYCDGKEKSLRRAQNNFIWPFQR